MFEYTDYSWSKCDRTDWERKGLREEVVYKDALKNSIECFVCVLSGDDVHLKDISGESILFDDERKQVFCWGDKHKFIEKANLE